MATCIHCNATIEWKTLLNGSKIPIYPAPRDDGGLMYTGDKAGTMTKYDGSSATRYRSHFLDCKKLALSLHKRKYIALGRETPECSIEGCEIPGRHMHCFKCESTEHLADVCEEDDAVKELVM